MTYIFPGYNAQLEEIDRQEEDFLFGSASALPQEELAPDRQWEAPAFEPQSNGVFDTFACTNFAICNVIEMMHKKRYGEEINLSDRFSAIVSGTIPGQGNSHKKVAESMRKSGFIVEEKYPFTELMGQAEYFTPPQRELLDTGLQWLVVTEFGYEKVERKDFWETLQLSPLQVAVDSRARTVSDFQGYDHSITIRAGEEGKKWNTTDNYLGRSLEYAWDYPFGFAQRYHYKRKEIVMVDKEQVKVNQFLVNIIQWLRSLGYKVVIV